jgi:cholesterol transport system auxiliary component
MKGWTVMVLACALAASIAGCVFSGARVVQRYYVLEASSSPAAAKATCACTLIVAPTTASSFYETPEIAYSRASGTRAYYQFNNWTERPSQKIGALLLSRLERSGSFQTVAAATSGVRGALLLSTHVEEIYHDATERLGSARITLTAELTDPGRQALVARHTFSRWAPAASYDAAGAVQGFNEAVGAILDDVVAWVEAATLLRHGEVRHGEADDNGPFNAQLELFGKP